MKDVTSMIETLMSWFLADRKPLGYRYEELRILHSTALASELEMTFAKPVMHVPAQLMGDEVNLWAGTVQKNLLICRNRVQYHTNVVHVQ